MLNNPDHKSGSESVRKAEAYYIKHTFKRSYSFFYGEHLNILALASEKMGEQFPNRAEAPRTRAEVLRTWAEVPRTWAKAPRSRAKVPRIRAKAPQKRRSTKTLGELFADFLHPIPTLFVLRPIGL